MSDALHKYVRKFSTLNRGNTKYGSAPHKPILLLAVLCGFDEGWIIINRIELSPQLVGTFKTIWHALVTTNHSPLIAQPFFHMRGEKFWHHVPNLGYEVLVQTTKSCKSIGVLQKAVDYVQLDPELFELMMSSTYRKILKKKLMETYFTNSQSECYESGGYWEQLTNKIMEEPANDYVAEVLTLQEQLDQNSFEEEVFVRGGVFKRQVPLVYNNTCCISGLRVETSINASLLDACHIVPFSKSHDDTISNGMALCPTLHRAFDRGLVAIEPDDFSVIVSDRLSEPVASVYSIRQFHGQKITRPENQRWWPRRDNLAAHLERFINNF